MISINGKELTFKQFPNGETLVDGEQIDQHACYSSNNLVQLRYENDSDLIKLMFVKKFMDEREYELTKLYVTYMPYSRMDRVEGLSVFTLKYVSQFINSLNFHSVVVVEPHSDVTTALLDKCSDVYPTFYMVHDVMDIVGFNKYSDYVFFPDAGAQKRYSKMIKGFNELVGFKKRDFSTGRISSLDVIGNVEHTGFKAVIVDDLCSYGGTFVMSAEKLRDLGASKVYLVVTHCENSILKGKLLDAKYTINTLTGDSIDLIDYVFTTTSIYTGKHDKIKLMR